MPTPRKTTATTAQRARRAPRTWAVIPPAVFASYVKASQDRADMQRRQNSPANDGRTGIIVDYRMTI